jgi:hypothetical protein
MHAALGIKFDDGIARQGHAAWFSHADQNVDRRFVRRWEGRTGGPLSDTLGRRSAGWLLRAKGWSEKKQSADG